MTDVTDQADGVHSQTHARASAYRFAWLMRWKDWGKKHGLVRATTIRRISYTIQQRALVVFTLVLALTIWVMMKVKRDRVGLHRKLTIAFVIALSILLCGTAQEPLFVWFGMATAACLVDRQEQVKVSTRVQLVAIFALVLCTYYVPNAIVLCILVLRVSAPLSNRHSGVTLLAFVALSVLFVRVMMTELRPVEV